MAVAIANGSTVVDSSTAFAISAIDYVKVPKELSPLFGSGLFERRAGISKQGPQLTCIGAIVLIGERHATRRRNQYRGQDRQGRALSVTSLIYFLATKRFRRKRSRICRCSREYLRLRVFERREQSRWEIQPLSGEIRSGDLIVSRLHVKGATAKYMMIEDPIPAGCEQVERISGLDLTYSGTTDARRWGDWYSSREFRDQKTALFVDYFDGDATFQVALRVQVPASSSCARGRGVDVSATVHRTRKPRIVFWIRSERDAATHIPKVYGSVNCCTTHTVIRTIRQFVPRWKGPGIFRPGVSVGQKGRGLYYDGRLTWCCRCRRRPRFNSCSASCEVPNRNQSIVATSILIPIQVCDYCTSQWRVPACCAR